MQSWPALKNAADADALGRGSSRSASAKTTAGALPPSSRWVRFTSAAAERATSMPARVEPVMLTRPGAGCSTSARPVSRSPQTTLSTPGGSASWRDLGEQRGAHRRGVARLEDDGVAGGERRADLPDRHHQRVVPGRHLPDDADRLAPDAGREAGQVLAAGASLEQPGRAGEEPELVDRDVELLAPGERRILPVFWRLGVDEVVGVLLDQVGELEHRLLALGRRASDPSRGARRSPRRRPGRRRRRPRPERCRRPCRGPARPARWSRR